jgi:hypothetical protein
MKGQKGGRVSMPFEYYQPLFRGNLSSNVDDVSLSRGEVNSTGCHMGPVLPPNPQIGGKKKPRRYKKSSKAKKSKARKGKAKKSRRGRK